MLQVPRTFTVKCASTCRLFAVHSANLLALLRDYPDIHEYLKLVARDRHNRVEMVRRGEGLDLSLLHDLEDEKTRFFAEGHEARARQAEGDEEAMAEMAWTAEAVATTAGASPVLAAPAARRAAPGGNR